MYHVLNDTTVDFKSLGEKIIIFNKIISILMCMWLIVVISVGMPTWLIVVLSVWDTLIIALIFLAYSYFAQMRRDSNPLPTTSSGISGRAKA